MPAKTVPDHHDAELIIKLYDLRREPVMRESRRAVLAQFWPKSFAEVQAVAKPDHPHNAAYRQVASYWEMAYGFCKHGVLHADMMSEASGEGIFVFAKIHPFLDDIRREFSPFAFQNAEWMVANSAVAKRQFELFSARVRKAMESK